MKQFLARWYFFWGDAVSRIMHYGILGCLYPLYNKWMGKSSRFDVNCKIWQKPDKESK